MFAWTVLPAPTAPEATTSTIRMLQRERLSPRAVRRLRKLLHHGHVAGLPPCLLRLYMRVVELAEQRSAAQGLCSSAVELLGSCDYARTAGSGCLGALGRVCGRAEAAFAEHILRCFEDYMHARYYEDTDCWFMVRARLMDLFSACVVSRATTPHVVFYGGSNHATNISQLLRRHSAYVVERAAHRAPPFDVEVLRRTDRDQRIVLLGEDHGATTMRDADELVRWMASRCDGPLPACTLLVERHRTLDEEPRATFPNQLACNAQDRIAIQRARCDAIVRAPCARLRVEFVDNRHCDLGFVRREVGETAADDPVYRELFVAFQRAALGDAIAWLRARVSPRAGRPAVASGAWP